MERESAVFAAIVSATDPQLRSLEAFTNVLIAFRSKRHLLSPASKSRKF